MGGAETTATRSRNTQTRGWITPTLAAFCLASVAVTVVAGLIQISFGTYSLSLAETWATVFDPEVVFDGRIWTAFLLGGDLPEMSNETAVVWNLRVPRVVVAVVAGSTLAVSGAILQGVTRNELASPFVLGVSSGAGFAVLATLVVYSGFAPYLPFIAAVGGAVAFLIVYAIAWRHGTSPVRLVLAGVIVNMVFQSLQQGLFFFAGDLSVVQSALEWTTGSLTGTGWDEVRLSVLPAIVTLLLALGAARQLNVLVLGDGTARSLGMPVERVRFLVSGVAILAASVAVSVAGIIAFFGLVVPHIVRTVVGSDYRQIVVGCLFAGPALLVAADVGARLALGGAQMPVGVVTGILGGPYFLYLMRKQRTMGDL